MQVRGRTSATVLDTSSPSHSWNGVCTFLHKAGRSDSILPEKRGADAGSEKPFKPPRRARSQGMSCCRYSAMQLLGIHKCHHVFIASHVIVVELNG